MNEPGAGVVGRPACEKKVAGGKRSCNWKTFQRMYIIKSGLSGVTEPEGKFYL